LSPTVLPLPAEEQLLSQQRQRRPDYQRALAEVRRMEFDEQAQKREFLPTLGAWAAWEMDNPSPANYGGSNWTAGISLRWNVFAGGADTARLQAARQRLEQGRLRLAALESSMALELRQAVIQVRSAGQQVETMRGAEAQSLESLRILRNRYEAGLATMTDLLAAQTAHAASRTALAESVYRYRISYARLEFAAGILSPTSPAMSH
jgi:outer membrane protein TolC